MADEPYDVSEAVNILAEQLGQTALRASVAEARLSTATKRVVELEQQLQRALDTVEALSPAPDAPTVLEHEG